MKKKLLMKIIFYLVVISLFFSQSNVSYAQSIEGPLYLIILIDASGSMKKTDPEGIRKLAAQAVVSLLSEQDRVSIIEFDSDVRILSEWKPASDKENLFKAINKASDNGEFTDFRVGLEKAIDMFKKADRPSRSAIMLLSDGIFEPNPRSSAYAPHHLEYRFEIAGKSKAERQKINEKFRKKLTPIATRIIDNDLLPYFRKNKIEIFTIAFSPDADKKFLKRLAKETNISGQEVHSFYAENATDLFLTFLGLLHYWENMMVLYKEEGEIRIGTEKQIFLDQYVVAPLVILLSESETQFKIGPVEGGNEEPIPGTHPSLTIIPLKKRKTPATWNYRFVQGQGKYRLLFLGKSSLLISIRNLKDKYMFGEEIRCLILPTVNNEDARSLLDPSSEVILELESRRFKYGPVSLENVPEGYIFSHTPKYPGTYNLKLTLFAKDKDGKELLPRPSKKYQFEVLPRIFIEPDVIRFEDVIPGDTLKAVITIHSGLNEEAEIKAIGEIKEASRCFNDPSKLPVFLRSNFSISPGESLRKEIQIYVPEDGCWGDFSGEVLFLASDNHSYRIKFYIHIPSIWEYLTYTAIFLLLSGTALIIILIYLWGTLGKPRGVLIVLERPLGVITSDSYPLDRVRRKNFFARVFNWRLNRVSIGSENADIKLPSLNPVLRIEFLFIRLGNKVYVFNKSPIDSKIVFEVQRPSFNNSYLIQPGQNIIIEHGTIIKIDSYRLKYVNF